MGNPFAGEVRLVVDGTEHRAKLTLGSLAELEAGLATGSLMDLIGRIESRQFSARDVLAVLLAGLHGAGWQGSASDLVRADIADGPIGAARAAAQLLARAFASPAE